MHTHIHRVDLEEGWQLQLQYTPPFQSFIHSVRASMTRCFTVCTSLISLVTVDTGIPVKVLYVTELRKLGS